MKSQSEIYEWIIDDENRLKRVALSGDQKKKLELEIGVLRKVLDDYRSCSRCGFPNETDAGSCVFCGREFEAKK